MGAEPELPAPLESPPDRAAQAPDSGVTADPRVELARERTVLAWIRTGLAIMAFGFLLARSSLILRGLGLPVAGGESPGGVLAGVATLVLGAWVNARAALRHFRHGRRLASPEASGLEPALVAAGTAIVGLSLVAMILASG